jgi:hypothetical protein
VTHPSDLLEDIQRRYLIDSIVKAVVWERGHGQVLFLQWHDHEVSASGETTSYVIRIQTEAFDIRVGIPAAWFASPKRYQGTIATAVESALPPAPR